MGGKRLLLILIGCIATSLAFIGVWIPGVPTVPFLLIALWAFAQSNQKLHRWLSRVPVLKSALKEARLYQRHKAVTRRVKIISQASAWVSAIIVIITVRSLWVVVAVVVAAALCSLFMMATPTRADDTISESL